MKRLSEVKLLYKLSMLAVLLVLLTLLASASLAAYVSRSYVKGVAATPKQGFLLSSDYLSPVKNTMEENLYPEKKILLTEKTDTDDFDYSFTFSITNTSDGTVSNKRIQYYLKISGLPFGTKVYIDNKDITNEVISENGYKASVMNAYTKVTHNYKVSIPKEVMTSAAEIMVKAIPDNDSDNSGYILAGKLQPSIVGKVASFTYNDKIIDTGSVSDYAAFNYQISISNSPENRKMMLSWNNKLIEIDPLFLKNFSNLKNPGLLSLEMNDINNSYLIQFYRLPGATIDKWEDLGLSFEPYNQEMQEEINR